jgi:hypothetical protein
MTNIDPAPVQDPILDDRSGQFTERWWRWFDDVERIINTFVSGSVISVNGETGVVTLDAEDIPYDNSTSGLTATDVQDAIDELAGTGIKSRVINTVDATYSVLSTDDIVRCITNSFTVTLPAGTTTGQSFTITNVDIGTITVDVSGGGTISGSLTRSLILNESTTVVADGTNWFEI